MIIWKGLGILVPVQFAVMAILIQAVIDAFWGQGYYSSNDWPQQLGMVVASISLLPVGLWLNRNQNPVESGPMLAPAPREPARHTFFFVPYQHWTWAGFGLLILLEAAR